MNPLNLTLAIIAAALLGLVPAQAQSIRYPDTVLELFTSQGCSSCPPANAFVRQVAANDDSVLALSYSVEYWDYLGWKDTLGDPAFSARQRDYGQHFQGQVYTPQMVVNGAVHSAVLQSADLAAYMLNRASPALNVVLAADGTYKCSLDGAIADPVITMVIYEPGVHSVDVKAGENRGRAISLANVVKEIKPLTMPASGTAYIPAPHAGHNTALLLQSGQGGPLRSAVILSASLP